MGIDEGALTACYRRCERRLFNVLYRLLWDPAECQDLMHEAFLKVWRSRDRVDAVGLDSLVFTAALNLARNRLRWSTLRRWVGLSGAEDAVHVGMAAHGPEGTAELARLRDAMAALPAGMREVLLLSVCAGMDTDEIAGVLGIPAGTVGSRKHAAVRRLKQQLGDAGE